MRITRNRKPDTRRHPHMQGRRRPAQSSTRDTGICCGLHADPDRQEDAYAETEPRMTAPISTAPAAGVARPAAADATADAATPTAATAPAATPTVADVDIFEAATGKRRFRFSTGADHVQNER